MALGSDTWTVPACLAIPLMTYNSQLFVTCCALLRMMLVLLHDHPAAVQAPQDGWQQDGFTTRIAAVACRYPQPACSADGCTGKPSGPGFWGALQGGANLQSAVPASRWDIDAVYMPDTAAKYAVTLPVKPWSMHHLCAWSGLITNSLSGTSSRGWLAIADHA
jgi:hypothetical protein